MQITRRHLSQACLLFFLWFSAAVHAQQNAIQKIEAIKESENVVIKVTLKTSLPNPPKIFSILKPARIVIDLPATINNSGQNRQLVNLGDLQAVDIVQSSDRSRLVLTLQKMQQFEIQQTDKELLVKLIPSFTSAIKKEQTQTETQKELTNTSTAKVVGASLVNKHQEEKSIVDIDFRSAGNGAGRIVVDLSSPQQLVHVRQQGQLIIADFPHSTLPEVLRRKLDVRDFSTPVQAITSSLQANMVRLQIEPTGLWEFLAWQTDRRLVIEVRPVKQDAAQAGLQRQYKGEKLSLNFQNIDVRALLQVVADFTGLNVVASDSVTGNLTLRLKDVPWDQALDIIMQARGLDMRKSGNVLWIAPKDELLTKERLELEQRAQISELEPLVTETFQMNYQKADNFRQVFGLDGQIGRGNILSRRGSASVEPRTNKLFVTDTASRLDEVRKLIQLTDVPTRQVMIEARIVEADNSFSKNLGAKLGFLDLRGSSGATPGVKLPLGTSASVTGNYLGVGEQTLQAATTAGSFVPNTQFVNLPAGSIGGLAPGSVAVSIFSVGALRFLNMELSALESDGKGKIISSPRVVTADQQPALIEQGEEIPYQQATSSGATSIQFKKANLKLEVTPQITPNGNIILMVDVAKDSRGTPAGGNFAINTKHVKTNVQVENGGTVVLGGIFVQTQKELITKVPFFGDLPLLGNLFRNVSSINDKTELLIFITPRVLSDPIASRH
ncbi:MAG: type IV pilus secretin PilQ [Burkholderiales bacterium]|nr:type IV pilus secretin PilQ [Burkholderiales bacterium]